MPIETAVSAIKMQNKNEYVKSIKEAVESNGIIDTFKRILFYLIKEDNVNFTRVTLETFPKLKEVSHTLELVNGMMTLDYAAKESPQILELLTKEAV